MIQGLFMALAVLATLFKVMLRLSLRHTFFMLAVNSFMPSLILESFYLKEVMRYFNVRRQIN